MSLCMETLIRMLPEFEHRAKALAKKYKSFVNDYGVFIESLKANPLQGKSLGGGVYKIRFSISSKAKGKSGGARILTYNVKKVNPEKYIVVLMSIYDKSEMDNVSDTYLKDILKEAKRLI